MGDVVTALARAVQDEGHEVEVVLPKYDIINYAEVSSEASCVLPSCSTCLVDRCANRFVSYHGSLRLETTRHPPDLQMSQTLLVMIASVSAGEGPAAEGGLLLQQCASQGVGG